MDQNNAQTPPPAPDNQPAPEASQNNTTVVPVKPKRKLPFAKILVAGIVILITVLAFGLIAYLMMGEKTKTQEITSYEECVAAGYPIMESYPEQCAVPGGPSFTRELTDEEKKKLDPTADWENYNNLERSYTFKYPNTYTLNETEVIGNITNEVTLEKEIEIAVGGGFGGGDALSKGAIIRFTVWSNKDISDQAIEDQFGNITISNTNINGVEFKTVSLNSNDNKVYFYEYTPEVLEIFLNLGANNTPEENEIYVNEFNQILSTFKFTDKNSGELSTVTLDENGWKIFTMPNYSISVPSEFNIDNDSSTKNYLSITNYDVNTAPGRGFSPSLDAGMLKIEIVKADTEKILDEYMNTEYSNEFKKIKINNSLSGYEVVGKEGPGTGYPTYFVENPTSKEFYYIHFWLDFNNFSELRNQILSTFKFTE